MRFTGTFVIVVALFVVVLITSNIIAVKPIQLLTLPFEFLGSSSVVLPAAIIIFPISYIIGDVLTEVYGFRIARGVIWLGFGANLLVVIALWLAGIIPGAGFWEDQDAYDAILGQVPWILLASFTAFLIGEFSNSTVLALLKYKMQGRLLFVRTIGSTVVGQGLDSFIFIYIAFGLGGDWSASGLLSAALAQWIIKILYETAATPLTYAVVGYMKRKEEMDVTDVPRSLNPVGIFA
jgi:uncharacterized integral membrane protein (TIGR00697 family)